MRLVVPYYLQAVLAAYLIWGIMQGNTETIDIAVMFAWCGICLGWICIPLPAREFFFGRTRLLPFLILFAVSAVMVIALWVAEFRISSVIYAATWLLLWAKKLVWTHEQNKAWMVQI